MITTLEEFETEEANEDINELVTSLFNIADETLLNKKLFPLIRLEKLNNVREEAIKRNYLELTEDKESKEIYKNAIDAASHHYLIRIFQDLLNIDINEFNQSETLIRNALYIIQKKITYFDTIDKNLNESLKELFNNDKEFNYTFLYNDRNCKKKRSLIIEEAFRGNHKRYLSVFKEKLLAESSTIYKQIVFLELQKLNYEELRKILNYFVYKPDNNSYITNTDNKNSKIALLLFENKYLGNLLTQNQAMFYSYIQSIHSKLKSNDFSTDPLTEYNITIIETLRWLKSSPKESLQTLEILNDLCEKDSMFAFDKPNNLILQISKLKEKISQLIGKPQAQISAETADNHFCNNVFQKTFHVCNKILDEETSIVKGLEREERNKKIRLISKKLFYIASIITIFALLKFGQYYFFDIQSIYSNHYLKNAKLIMESTPYSVELKDSLDPVKNETNQKLRLDYIKDLNSRYFKVLTIFLNPNVSDNAIKSSLASLTIPEDIKNIDSIKAIRNSLSKLINLKEWDTNIEPMLGPNVLSELRAYGAICNFLIPSLAHYVIVDNNGLPLKINGMIQISNTRPEKETLRKALLNRFNRAPNDTNIEPKVYLDNFDLNYRNITTATNKLLSKTLKMKSEIINEYKRTSSEKEKIKLKTVLKGIAVLEIKLDDLKSKIQERRDFIVKHNTYRVPLE